MGYIKQDTAVNGVSVIQLKFSQSYVETIRVVQLEFSQSCVKVTRSSERIQSVLYESTLCEKRIIFVSKVSAIKL